MYGDIGRNRPKGPEVKIVHEHRAPTEDSVRLLREMEAKAREAVERAVRVTDSPIDCVIHVSQDDLNDMTTWRCIYKLNGERRVVDYFHFRGLGDDKMAPVHGLVAKLAEDIAKRLVSQFLMAHRELLP